MPAIIDSTQAQVTTTSAVSVPAPTLQDGCVVYLFLATRGQTTMSVPPAGFTEVTDASGATSTGASGARVFTYRRFVATAAGEPANYTCTTGASLHGSVIAVSVSGVDPSAPVLAAALTPDTGSDANVVCPAVDVDATDTLVLRLACMTTSVGVASWATGDCTEIEDVPTAVATSRCSAALGWEDQPAAGSTSTATWTVTLVGGSTSYGSAVGVTLVAAGPQVHADAGGPQDVEPGDTVNLDSSGSTGDILSRLWAQESGDVTVILANPTGVVATFVAPKPPGSDPMELVFQVEVTGAENSDTATTTVTVSPVAPPSLGVFILDANGDAS